MLTSRGLGVVLGDLAAMGFDARWGVLGAADVGAPHHRDRIWIVGVDRDTNCNYERTEREVCIRSVNASRVCQEMAHTDGMRQLQPQRSESDQRGRVGDSGEQVANASEQGLQREQWSQSEGDGDRLTDSGTEVAHTDFAQRKGDKCTKRSIAERTDIGKPSWWVTEPNVGRVANGVAARVDRLKSIGNGQVPLCAATAWKLLTGEMK